MIVGGKVDHAAPADHSPSGEARTLQVRLLHVVVRRGAVLRDASTPTAASAATMPQRTGFRCDLPAVGYRMVRDKNALLSFTHDAPAISIDPVSTGGPGWDEFLKAFNEFSSAHNGHPLFNQTKHLTPEQVGQGLRQALGRVRAGAPRARSRQPPALQLLRHAADQRRHGLIRRCSWHRDRRGGRGKSPSRRGSSRSR